jgi:hypothetical protein
MNYIPFITYRTEKKRKRKKPQPPLCNVTGDWLLIGTYDGMSFPYTASLVQTGSFVTGTGVSSENPLNTVTITSGSVAGDVVTLYLEFVTDGYHGFQVNTGIIDCESRLMSGIWSHIGGFGLQGTWTATQV